MKENLTIDLLSQFEAIKDQFIALPDERMRKDLIRKTCQEVTNSYDSRVAANTMNIIEYYLVAEKVEIDAVIIFLKRNIDFDRYTMLQEEKGGFDKEYGTTTSLVLRQYELPETVSLRRFENSGRCHPSPVSSVKMALQKLRSYDAQYDDFVFIDVGSGLGRNLLLASDYAFKKIIGIEHSQYLHDVTVENVRIFLDRTRVLNNFELLCLNALDFSFPAENMVLYFWRPFSDEIAAEFIKKLESFIVNNSYKVFLFSLGQEYPAFNESALLNKIEVFTTPDLINDGLHFTISVYSNKHV